MAGACPLPDDINWIKLKKEFGEEKAMEIFVENNEETPNFESVVGKIPKHNGIAQDDALKILRENDALFMGYETVERTIDGIKVPFERYKLTTGHIVRQRVTDKQSRIFARNKTMAEVIAINNRPENIIKRETGTKMHKVLQDITNDLIAKKEPTKPVDMTQVHFDELVQGVKAISKEIQDMQNKIDPTKKVRLISEQKLYDEKEDVGGSIDLLAVFSDGSAATYDYKFINFKTKKGVVVDFEETLAFKNESFESQAQDYKKMLDKVIGIKLVRQSRVVPINIQFGYDKSKKTITDRISKLQMGYKGSRDYLKQIPLAEELTMNEKMNDLLKKLQNQFKVFKSKLRKGGNTDFVRNQMKRTNEAIVGIQRDMNVLNLVAEINSLSDEVLEFLSINDQEDVAYISSSDLVEYKGLLETYSNLLALSGDVLRVEGYKDSKKAEELKIAISDVTAKAATTAIAVNEKIKERVLELAENLDIVNIFEAQKDTRKLSNQFKYLSDWTHPVFKATKKLIDQAIDNKNRELRDFHEELKEVTDKLQEWGKKNGYKGTDVYKILINENTGNLIAEFKDDLWKELKAARSVKDIGWFKENYEYTEENKKAYEEALARQKEYFQKWYGKRRTKEEITKMIKQWEAKNNPKFNDAWFGKYAYITLKDRNKWQSDEYKKIQSIPEVKAFYEFHIKKVEEFNKMIPKELRTTKNFVANIRKETIDMVAQNGLSYVKGMGKTFVNGLTVRDTDTHLGHVNPATGEIENNVPILYLRPITNKDGIKDLTQKSQDLASSLTLFADTIYNYKNMSAIEDGILSLRTVLSENEQILTDDKGESLGIKVKGSQNTLEALDTYIDFYLYGKKLQGKDIAFKLGDETYSGSKILKAMMKHHSLATLALNPISAAGAYIGAKSNAAMVGKKGKYYTTKQFMQATKLAVTFDKKYMGAYKYFEIMQDDMTHLRAKELSASSAVRKFTEEAAFSWLRKADEMVDANVTVAMMMNYGVDPADNKVKPLDKFGGKESLWNLATTDKEGNFKIDITDAQYDTFRRKVRYIASTIKGQYSSDDIMALNTTMYGQAIMQYRNWMPRIVGERFRKPRYNETMEDVEIGRFRAFAGEFAVKGALESIRKFVPAMTSLLVDSATFGARKYKLDTQRVNKRYLEFITENPELADVVSAEDFRKELEGQIRALAAEVRMYLLVLGALMVATSDWDDDGEKNIYEIPGGRQMLRLIEKANLELGFVFRPSEAMDLLRSPAAVIGYVLNIERLLVNSLDETKDFIVGEDEKNDKSPMFKYTTKFIPGVKPATDFFEFFEKDFFDQEGFFFD